MKLSEILRAGKANIERYGWCQGDELAIQGGIDCKCCAATAMMQIPAVWNISDNGPFEFFRKVNDIPSWQSIGMWNDKPERTEAEVLAAFDKAITAAEAQEQGQ